MSESVQFAAPEHVNFRAALEDYGIVPPPELVADGDIHRCDIVRHPGRGDASYMLRPDGHGGGYQDWSNGAGWQYWRIDPDHRFTAEELANLREQIEADRAQREAEKTARRANVSRKARKIWEALSPCTEHPYCTQKGIKPHGTRITHRGDLVVPLYDADGDLHNLQFIGQGGSKRYLAGGRVGGCYYRIGDAPSNIVMVGEGFATCATIFEAMVVPIAVAFDCYNLASVAFSLREKFPNARIVITADDDHQTEGNPGLTKAREAAAAVGGVVAVPDFGPNRPAGLSDFNDLEQHVGTEAVWRCIEAAMASSAQQQSSIWPDPDMAVLRLTRRAPPALPLELFGPDWARWIGAAAESAACSPDYVAAPLLASVSTLIGHARWAQANDGWLEPPHLWLSAVGDSGTGKSPGADPLFRDILPNIERRMLEDFPDALRLWRVANETAKAAEEIWKKEIREAQKEGKPLPAPPPPPGPEPRAPRLRQNDVTIEKLATLLAASAPKGLLINRDELAGWITGMNNYNSAGRAFWIEAFGGRPFRVERQKNPEPIDIPRLAVAVYGSVQPDKLSALMHDGDDGLLARILWAWPELVLFRLGSRAPGIEWATEALDRLRELDLQPGDPPHPIKVPLVAEALPLLEEFARDLQRRQVEAGGLLRSAFGKGRGLALRLSLVLEFLWWCGFSGADAPPTAISVRAFAAAAALLDRYFLPMAERVYGDAALPDSDRHAATIARWILQTRPSLINARDIRRKAHLPGLSVPENVRLGLTALVEADWITPVRKSSGSSGGRPREDHIVNPRVFEEAPDAVN